MKANIVYYTKEEHESIGLDITDKNLPLKVTFKINRRVYKLLINDKKIAKLQFRFKGKWREISLKSLKFVEEFISPNQKDKSLLETFGYPFN